MSPRNAGGHWLTSAQVGLLILTKIKTRPLVALLRSPPGGPIKWKLYIAAYGQIPEYHSTCWPATWRPAAGFVLFALHSLPLSRPFVGPVHLLTLLIQGHRCQSVAFRLAFHRIFPSASEYDNVHEPNERWTSQMPQTVHLTVRIKFTISSSAGNSSAPKGAPGSPPPFSASPPTT